MNNNSKHKDRMGEKYNYIFDKEAVKIVSKFIGRVSSYVGDFENDPASIYWNDGAGSDSITVYINQDTGRVEVAYGNPEDEEDNRWGPIGPSLRNELFSHVINVKRAKAKENAKKQNKNKVNGLKVAMLYEEMTNRSSKPGTGPANTIRKFLGIQPPTIPKRTPIEQNYNNFSTGGGYSYIFDEGAEKAIETLLSSYRFDKSNYSQGQNKVHLEHWKTAAEVTLTIDQETGRIKVEYDTPSDPKYNDLAEIVPDLVKELRTHIVNLKEQNKLRKEEAGQEFAIAYEKLTNQSAKPGTGPANTIRRFANIQPPTLPRRTPIQQNYNRAYAVGFKNGGGGTRKVKKSYRRSTRKA